jgi:fatty-acyl-CoA synthase|nr:hypothetical protein [Aeromicrobium sp.]
MSQDPQAHARWQFLNVHHIVEKSGTDQRQPAVVMGDTVITHGELRSASRRVGNGLIDAGVRPGDRVAITARNRVEYFSVEFGISEAAAVMVAMSWRLTGAERVRLLNRSRSQIVFAEADFVDEIAAARSAGELPDLRLIVAFDPSRDADLTYADLCASAAQDPPDVEAPTMTDVHEIIYTSGTTGEPKGVMWSHGTVLWNNAQQIIDYGLRPGDSTYVALDLNYIGGRHDFTLAILQQGGTAHLRPSGGFDPREILTYLSEHGVSHVLWVPTMLHDVLQQTDLLMGEGALDLSGLRMIMCGGSPLSSEMITLAQQSFPASDFVQVFGLTEGGGTPTFVPSSRLKEKVGSAGLPSTYNEIRIVADDGSTCPPGEIGEILVRGPAVTPGYWGNPEASAALVVDGWLHTGDLGRTDDEGFLYVAGRSRDLIITGGMNVFPADVEHVIAEHPAVDLVAVVGLPDERWGESICAVVKVRPGQHVTEQDVIAHCKERVAGYKKPKTVEFVDTFPMTTSGKIRKGALVERILATRTVQDPA